MHTVPRQIAGDQGLQEPAMTAGHAAPTEYGRGAPPAGITPH